MSARLSCKKGSLIAAAHFAMYPNCPIAKSAIHLPVVQLLGAQKAGTSALADWLFDEGGFTRPKVFAEEPPYYSKEVHYFDSEWRYRQGPAFYAKRFEQSPSADGLAVAMDATPDTLPFADRVRSTYDAAGPNQTESLKIIVILREPISRELSLYNHLAFDCRRLQPSARSPWHTQVTREDGSIMSFDEFVFSVSIPSLARSTGPGRSTRHSLYEKHLKAWFDLFRRDQILVLSYDELQNSPGKLQHRVQVFLERVIPGSLSKSNSNDSPDKVTAPSHKARTALEAVFSPANDKLYELLRRHPGPAMEQTPFPRFY